MTSPILNTTTLPAPTFSTQELLINKSVVETAQNKTAWGVRSQKYRYVLTWNFMTVADYDALEILVNDFDPLTFIWDKYSTTISPGISVLAQLSDRRAITVGTQTTSFYSKVALTLTEMDAR